MIQPFATVELRKELRKSVSRLLRDIHSDQLPVRGVIDVTNHLSRETCGFLKHLNSSLKIFLDTRIEEDNVITHTMPPITIRMPTY